MVKHASIEEAKKLLEVAYYHVGRDCPPQIWIERTEKWLEDHKDYGDPIDPKTFSVSGVLELESHKDYGTDPGTFAESGGLHNE